MSCTRADRSLVVLPLLVALALAVRVGVAARTAAIFNDGPHFLRLSELFANGSWTQALADHYHPLYPILIAALSPFTSAPQLAALAVSVLAGSASVAALYVFVRRAFDAQSAWIAGVLLALHPYAASFSSDVQSEGLYFAFFLGAVAWLWRAIETAELRSAMAAGAMLGLAYLVRPEGLGLLAVAAAFALLRAWQRRWPLLTSVRWLAVVCVAAAVFAGPYVVHLRVSTGQWMLTQKKSLSELTSSPDARLERERAPRTPAGARLQTAPTRALEPRTASLVPAAVAQLVPGRISGEPRSLTALLELLRISQSALHASVAVLLGLGLYLARGRPGDRGLYLAAIVGVYAVAVYALTLNVGYLDRRHVLAPLIPLFGYVAIGLTGVAKRLLQLRRRSPGTAAQQALAVWSCVAIVALLVLPKTFARHREERLATRRAAEWLASRSDRSGPVAAEKERTAWYAGEPFIRLVEAEPGVDPSRLYRRGARFLVVDESQLARWQKLDAAVPGTLVELHRSEAAGRTAFVYAIAKPKEKERKKPVRRPR